MFTMLCATPRFVLGLDVRAMSKPTTDPGPSADSTTTRTTNSHIGAGPDNDSTTVQIVTFAAMMPSNNHERRIG